MRDLRKTLVGAVLIATVLLPTASAIAGPLDPVWDIYDRKLGCGSQDPVLCPGP